ncbi:MAG TPA: hypothetical protein VFE13_15925 [Caulobacteraceae bacterium]|nr:hypothetical protein [Caulobacteraceae bacterium]
MNTVTLKCALTAVALALAACHPASAQTDAQQKVAGCAAMADEYLDPHWGPREVSGDYPAAGGGVRAVIAAQAARVTVTCGIATGYGMHMLGDLETIQGVEPAPGQLYLPGEGRWLTAAELHERLMGLLGPRPGEYAGAAWAPNEPGVYTVSDLAGAPSTACFTLQSRLEPARMLVACEVRAQAPGQSAAKAVGGHRYFANQRQMTVELAAPPTGLPPVPPAPPTDWTTQPGGAPP